MSEAILTVKISDTISDVFKKTKIFEKIESFEFYVGSFVFISSIIGIAGITVNYYSNKSINNKLDKLNKIHKLVEQNNREICEIKNLLNENQSKISIIRDEYIMLFDRQQKITQEILNLPLLNICNINNNNISRESSDLSTLIEDTVEKKETIIQETKEIPIEEDELVNECYDSIPLSNAKKLTGIKSLIWFNN